MLQTVDAIADGVIATALSTADLTEQRRNVAFQGLASLVASVLDASQSERTRSDALERMESRNAQMLNAGRPENGPPSTTLHWPLAFPEAFSESKFGFDAIVGNPPFVGGQKIGAAFGSDYRAHLVQHVGEGRRGSADLVAYFFLRAAVLAGSFGFLAVNTIAQGATREVGLEVLVSNGWRIFRASKSRPWPGKASVHISQLWLARVARRQPAMLDDEKVRGITSLLSQASRVEGKPLPLAANAGIAFQGSIVLGMGFTMPPEAAAELIRKDERNRDVLFPFINGEDLGSRPDLSPSRWIINFFDWPLERAETYPDCLAIVRARVKLERDRNREKSRREIWWRFTRPTLDLYAAIKPFERVILMPQVSRMITPVMSTTGMVFSHSLGVMASDSLTMFGILSSQIHRLWARKYGSTHLTITNYNLVDCFETFPFARADGMIGAVVAELDAFRSDILRQRKTGLTLLSQQMHKRETIDNEVCKLRELYQNVDLAVCAAYGWGDLDLSYVETAPGF